MMMTPPTINYNADPITNSESFKYKRVLQEKHQMQIKKMVKTPSKETQRLKRNLEIVVQIKHLSSFWRSLEMPLINCEVSLTSTWSENYVLTDITTQTERNADSNADRLVETREKIDTPTNAIFKITDTKLYIPVVTLSTKDDNNFLEQLKSEFKRTIRWNKYRSEMTNQTKTNHLNHLIDPTFSKVNRLFVLSFENEEDRTSFSKCYVPKVEIKEFKMLIDGKSFFDVPVKNKEEAYEKL